MSVLQQEVFSLFRPPSMISRSSLFTTPNQQHSAECRPSDTAYFTESNIISRSPRHNYRVRTSPFVEGEFLEGAELRCALARCSLSLSLSLFPRLSVPPSDPERQSVHEWSPERQQRRRRRFKGGEKYQETGRPHCHTHIFQMS